uniref:Uncharacterized protein n=1 Tax=Quercus lobata TaxID=97700 RepID=A0A7N2LKK4_QUELO
MDNTVGIVTGVNFEHISMIELDNQINSRIAFFSNLSLSWVVYLFLRANHEMNECLAVVEECQTIRQSTIGCFDLIASQVSVQLKILDLVTVQSILQNPSSSRAIWGWDDSYIFIGNRKRGVDAISSTRKRTIFTNPRMPAIPSRFDAHPYKVGMLAGATCWGHVYIWKLG